jgi:putative membrane protein
MPGHAATRQAIGMPVEPSGDWLAGGQCNSKPGPMVPINSFKSPVIHMSLMLTLHIVFLIIWSATLLYFPQMFVEQVDAEDADTRRRAIRMQHALYVFAMTPSAVLTVLAGSWMLFERGFAGGWLPVKLSVVLMMVFLHLYFGHLMEHLRQKGPKRSLYYYRSLSLAPAILITVVVTLVVAKPF